MNERNKKILFAITLIVTLVFILPKMSEPAQSDTQMKGIYVAIPNISSDTLYATELWQNHNNKIMKIIGQNSKIALEYPNEAFAIIDIPATKYDEIVGSLRKNGYYVRDEMIFEINLDKSVPAIGAPFSYTDFNGINHTLTGAGSVIAVLDTGIDCGHPDFNDCNMDGAGKILNWYDAIDGTSSPFDNHDHGTHVASIIAGTGAASSGKYKGVAPEAGLIIVRVCDDNGQCLERDLIKGLQWLIDNPQGIDVISMSIGYYYLSSDNPTAEICRGTQDNQKIQIYNMIEDLINNKKILVLASAGNKGVRPGSITFPACMDDVIAVGETFKENPTFGYWLTSNDKWDRSGTVHLVVEVNGETYMDATWEGQDSFGTGYQTIIYKPFPVTVKVKIEAEWKYWCPVYNGGWNTFEWGPYTFNSGSNVALEVALRPIYTTWNFGVCRKLYWDDPSAANTIFVNVYQPISELKNSVVFHSGRGPAAQGTQKPDVVAPGHQICAAHASGTSNGENICGNSNYAAMSGSSMAVPHVAGLVALIREFNPDIPMYHIKDALKKTLKIPPYDPTLQGSGLINVGRAVDYINTCVNSNGIWICMGNTRPGGMFCPTLFVWNGFNFEEETLLKIHDDNNNASDLTIVHSIEQNLVAENAFYKLQLRELDNFTSHVDLVKLYVVDDMGKRYEANLVQAVHSSLGDVKDILLYDDETRINMFPTDLIELRFNIPKVKDPKSFVFEINGYNQKCVVCGEPR